MSIYIQAKWAKWKEIEVLRASRSITKEQHREQLTLEDELGNAGYDVRWNPQLKIWELKAQPTGNKREVV